VKTRRKTDWILLSVTALLVAATVAAWGWRSLAETQSPDATVETAASVSVSPQPASQSPFPTDLPPTQSSARATPSPAPATPSPVPATPSPVPLTPTLPPVTVTPMTDAQGICQEPLSADAFTADQTEYYVKAFKANIRTAPGTDTEIIRTAVMGDHFQRTGYGVCWSRLDLGDGQTGFILTDLITQEKIYPLNTKPEPEPTDQPQVDDNGIFQEPLPVASFTSDQTRFYVKAYTANLRQEPNTDSRILDKLAMGDVLTRTGYGTYWSRVKTADGTVGFVLTRLISASFVRAPVTPAPTAAPTPRPTATPEPTAVPTSKPTDSPAPTADPTPAGEPSPAPSASPTPDMTPEPSPSPTPEPEPEENAEFLEMARIVALEGSPTYGYDSYLAVATVIMNQVDHRYFPNTVMGVISYPGHFSTYTSTRKPYYNDAVYEATRDAYYNRVRNMPKYVIAFITPLNYEKNVAAGGAFSKMEVYTEAYGVYWCYYPADRP
jgi:uncharacterized protein YgiM (DUF1202 family)